MTHVLYNKNNPTLVATDADHHQQTIRKHTKKRLQKLHLDTLIFIWKTPGI